MSKINFCEVFENIADKAEQCEQISKTIERISERISHGATKMEQQDEIYKSLKDIIINCLMIRKELVEVERAAQSSVRELNGYIEE